jgi:cation diffusion facilitator family transporter
MREMDAAKEKRWVALSSVLAAVFLTATKLIIGLLTNSLGILSEAAHSGLDLVAAGVTYLAVRASDRPPDREHTYGHGKIENLSALFETLLLLATCVWIIYEAISRLIQPVRIEVSLWSFLVMVLSIIIDISRSRALMRTAVKYKSQALEADAIHFSTDIWSSAVVILGLISVWLADWLEANTELRAAWLHNADAVAALGVSAIVIYVSYQLGRRTINALLDSASANSLETIEKLVLQVPGVTEIERIRVRQSGPTTFVDIRLAAPHDSTLEEAHRTAMEAQYAIEQEYPNSDIMIHLDPVIQTKASLVDRVRNVAGHHGLRVHEIRSLVVLGAESLSFHVEVPEDLTLNQAHERVTALEDELRRTLPNLGEIISHIEPAGSSKTRHSVDNDAAQAVNRVVRELPSQISGIMDCHQISVFSAGEEISVSFHCHADADLPIADAHQLTIDVENTLRSRLPFLDRVIIHLEPHDPSQESHS